MYTITHRRMTQSGSSDYERISMVYVAELSKWMTVDEVIADIDNKRKTFVVKQGGRTAYVGVYREAGRRPHIRTYADDRWNNNLLALPEA